MYLGVEKNRKFRDNFAIGPGKGSPRDNRSFSDGIPKHFSQFFSIALKRYKLEILGVRRNPVDRIANRQLYVGRKHLVSAEKKQVPRVRMSALSKFPIPRRWTFLLLCVRSRGPPNAGIGIKMFLEIPKSGSLPLLYFLYTFILETHQREMGKSNYYIMSISGPYSYNFGFLYFG